MVIEHHVCAACRAGTTGTMSFADKRYRAMWAEWMRAQLYAYLQEAVPGELLLQDARIALRKLAIVVVDRSAI